MLIREATPDDNSELQRLQSRCPQGTTIVFSGVNTPDFFARAKAYESYRVFAAHEEGRIVGSIACALRDGLVSGALTRVGYGFQAFVDPDYRRKGVATQLHRCREDYPAQQGAALIYALTIEGNRPSMRLLEGRGFGLHRTLPMPGLAVYQQMDVSSPGRVRPVEPGELGQVAQLLNETWDGYELYEPTSADKLARFVDRTPAYELDNLLVLEDGGEILACLGFWDWSRITRLTVLRLSPKMWAIDLLLDAARLFRAMPHTIRPGDTLKQMVLTPIGFRDPDHLVPLIRHVNNQALRRGVEQLFCVCERDHPLLRSTKGFIRVDTGLNLYVKPLRDGAILGNGPVYVDGIDL